MKGDGMCTERNPSVELLRCMSMYLVVLHHCHCHGIFSGWWSALFVLVLWHVDCFIAISGWYGISFKPSKVLRLWGQMAFYSVLMMVFCWFRGQPQFLISGGWFGNTYLFLMFVAPLVNLCISSLDNKVRRRLLASWMLVALGVICLWCPWVDRITALRPSGVSPNSFAVILFVYVTAMIARKVGFSPSKMMVGKVLLWYVGVSIVLGCVCAWRTIGHGGSLHGEHFLWCTNNLAPHVWLLAVVLCAIFATRVKVGRRLGRVAVFLTPSMFGVYLLHDGCQGVGRILYVTPENWLYAHTSIPPFFIIVVVSIGVFMGGLAVDLIRRGVVKMVWPLMVVILDRLDRRWESVAQRWENKIYSVSSE